MALATCYEAIEDWDNAQETLEKLLKLKPENVQALHDLAIIYHNKNRASEAMALVERLKKINPGNAERLLMKMQGK